MPSQMATNAPRIQRRIACGPLVLASRIGMVMNGPTPIISSMFADVAPKSPTPRTRWGVGRSGKGIRYHTDALRRLLAIWVIFSASLAAQSALQQAVDLARHGKYAEARERMAGVPEPADLPQRIAFHRLRAA